MDRKEYYKQYWDEHKDKINHKRRKAGKPGAEGIHFVNGKDYHPHARYELLNEMVEKLHKICKRPDLPSSLFLKIGHWYEEPNFRDVAIPTKGIKEGSYIAVFGADLKSVGIATYDKVKDFRVARDALFESHFAIPPEAFEWFEV